MEQVIDTYAESIDLVVALILLFWITGLALMFLAIIHSNKQKEPIGIVEAQRKYDESDFENEISGNKTEDKKGDRRNTLLRSVASLFASRPLKKF